MQEFEISLFQFSNSMFTDQRQFSFKNILKFVVEFYIKLKFILRIITYLAYIQYVWEIDHFVIKNDILGDFSILKLFLKLSCYHDTTTEIINGFVSKARVSACMYFLVNTGCIKKKRNLGISQEIDIVLKTKDFRRLGI
jgi:hypothetical protein